MKVITTHQGFAPGAHAGISETIERWAREHLEPLLSQYAGELRLMADIKRHDRGEAKYSIVLRMRLPRKQMLLAQGINADLPAALAQAEERLLREAKRYKDRLHHQADRRRKARRARLRELKAQANALSAEAAEQARGGVEPLLHQLERVVRRELAYLRNSGELPADYPSVQDVVDEAVLAVMANWRQGEPADAVSRHLLRAAFKALDVETETRRRYGEPVSLEASPAQDAEGQAESMVEEEIFEYYQPDEVLRLSDVLQDETAIPPESELEAMQREFSLETLGDVPVLWRRVWMLSEFERLAVADIAGIMEMELERVEQFLNQARAFLHDHLRQAGF